MCSAELKGGVSGQKGEMKKMEDVNEDKVEGQHGMG